MKTKFVVGLAALLGISFAGQSASAEPKERDRGYGYIFDDDALKAEGNAASIAQITVVKTAHRDRLLRPRVHFIDEMLKSVEGL